MYGICFGTRHFLLIDTLLYNWPNPTCDGYDDNY